RGGADQVVEHQREVVLHVVALQRGVQRLGREARQRDRELRFRLTPREVRHRHHGGERNGHRSDAAPAPHRWLLRFNAAWTRPPPRCGPSASWMPPPVQRGLGPAHDGRGVPDFSRLSERTRPEPPPALDRIEPAALPTRPWMSSRAPPDTACWWGCSLESWRAWSAASAVPRGLATR